MLTEEDINEYYEDLPEKIYCPHCEKRGYPVQLGPKILMPNESRPEDYDQFLECPTCYWICPIHEIPKEETIKDSIETQESPYEDKLKLESAHKRRKSKTGKKIAARGGKRRKRALHIMILKLIL